MSLWCQSGDDGGGDGLPTVDRVTEQQAIKPPINCAVRFVLNALVKNNDGKML